MNSTEIVTGESHGDNEANDEAAFRLERGEWDLVPIIEALLFVSSEPVTVRQLRSVVPDADREELLAALERLRIALDDPARGIQLQAVAGGSRLVTKPGLDRWVRALHTQRKKQRLSTAARETLAILAYKQPITAPEITEIRGVDCSSALRGLLERKLIRMLGRKEVVGRPILYGTSKDFLVRFGLKGLQELPTLAEFEEFAASALPDEVNVLTEESDVEAAVSEGGTEGGEE